MLSCADQGSLEVRDERVWLIGRSQLTRSWRLEASRCSQHAGDQQSLGLSSSPKTSTKRPGRAVVSVEPGAGERSQPVARQEESFALGRVSLHVRHRPLGSATGVFCPPAPV